MFAPILAAAPRNPMRKRLHAAIIGVGAPVAGIVLGLGAPHAWGADVQTRTGGAHPRIVTVQIAGLGRQDLKERRRISEGPNVARFFCTSPAGTPAATPKSCALLPGASGPRVQAAARIALVAEMAKINGMPEPVIATFTTVED